MILCRSPTAHGGLKALVEGKRRRSILSPAVSRRAKPIPATLRKWRKNHGKVLGIEYTQGLVALVCHVTLRTVQSWEQGWRRPGPTVSREKLAHAYGVTVAEVDILLGGGNAKAKSID